MALSPQLQPGNHSKLTGTDVLSQVARDYLSHTAFVHIFTQKFLLHRIWQKISCNPASKFLPLLKGGFSSSPQGLSTMINFMGPLQGKSDGSSSTPESNLFVLPSADCLNLWSFGIWIRNCWANFENVYSYLPNFSSLHVIFAFMTFQYLLVFLILWLLLISLWIKLAL